MRIRLSVPDNIIDGPIIDAALEAATRGNEALAARGLLPDLGDALSNGLKWRPEPWLGERFDLAPDCVERGWGDCDDLGPWLAAQLRAAGEDARAFARQSGRKRWHVLVERPDGQILDPSLWAGMPASGGGKELLTRPSNPSIAGPGESAICVVPHGGKWHARADLPLTERLHVSGWGRDQDASRAIARAIGTYAAVAEGCHGIGDPGVDVPLRDIVSSVLPLTGTATGLPLHEMPECRLGPMSGEIRGAVMGAAGIGRSIQGPSPRGWRTSAAHAIAGPGGHGQARMVHSPGGGPVMVRF